MSFSRRHGPSRSCYFRPRVEQLESRELLAALNPGALNYGTIGMIGEVDTFTFSAKQLDKVSFLLKSTPTQGNFVAYVTLTAPSGANVASFSATAGEVVRELKENGVYSLKVQDYYDDYLGNYSIGFEGISPISPNPLPLSVGGLTWASIDNVIEREQFTFQGASGGKYQFMIAGTPTRGDFHAYAELYSPAGNLLRAFTSSSGSVEVTLPDLSGKYMLQVSDYDRAATGSFRIGVEGVSPRSPNPISLIRGGITKEEIKNTIEKDQFTFYDAGGSDLQFVLLGSATQGEFRPNAALYSPSGVNIRNFSSSSGDTAFTLPDEPGNYMLQISDYNFAAKGTYSIGFESTSPVSPDPRELPRNAKTAGEIGAPIEKDQFTFRGIAGESITLQLTDSPIDAGFRSYAVLYAPSGNVVRNFLTESSGQLRITLPNETGRYMLQVSDFNLAKRGGYEVELTGAALPTFVETPANLRKANVWAETVDVNFDDLSDNETRFEIAASFDRGQSWVTIGQAPANARAYRIRYLEPGQTYLFRVRAANDQAASDYGNTITVTTRLIAPVQSATKNLGTTSLDLTWIDKSANETRFDVFMKLPSATTWTRIGQNRANAKSFHVTGLNSKTTYQFAVQAVNASATSKLSNIINVTTL